MLIRILFCLFIVFIALQLNSKAQKCIDYMLLQGPENISAYGVDTTDHWWSVIESVKGSYRMVIDGKRSEIYRNIKNLVFSPDGNRWAYFAQDNVQWYLIANDTTIMIPASDVGDMNFSPNSQSLVYSYMEGEYEKIILPNKKINVYQRQGNLYLSQSGDKFAFIGFRGDLKVININGVESPAYQDIKPIGFWYDNKMIYAAKNGTVWEIYKDDKAISETYMDIYDCAINNQGNVFAVLARQSGGRCVGILFSDEYTEPIISKPYDNVSSLALHPSLPMFAFKGSIDNNYFIVLNNIEYHAGREPGIPFFTYDGSDLYFLGCDLDCFVNVNGQKYSVPAQFDLGMYYAMKPSSKTIAYTTSTSMAVREIEFNRLYAGMMVDELIPPRYNWRKQRYESLGKINQKLYLLTCNF